MQALAKRVRRGRPERLLLAGAIVAVLEGLRTKFPAGINTL
jgi:hypothetical protein